MMILIYLLWLSWTSYFMIIYYDYHKFHSIQLIIQLFLMSRRGSVVEARFPIEHRKRSSKAGGQCLGGWPPLAAGWHAGPRTLKGAGARKICRGSNVLHVSIIPLGVPSQVSVDLSSGSWFKIKRPKS